MSPGATPAFASLAERILLDIKTNVSSLSELINKYPSCQETEIRQEIWSLIDSGNLELKQDNTFVINKSD